MVSVATNLVLHTGLNKCLVKMFHFLIRTQVSERDRKILVHQCQQVNINATDYKPLQERRSQLFVIDTICILGPIHVTGNVAFVAIFSIAVIIDVFFAQKLNAQAAFVGILRYYISLLYIFL